MMNIPSKSHGIRISADIKKEILPYPYLDSYIVLVSKQFITIQNTLKLWNGDDFVYFTEIEELDIDEK